MRGQFKHVQEPRSSHGTQKALAAETTRHAHVPLLLTTQTVLDTTYRLLFSHIYQTLLSNDTGIIEKAMSDSPGG